jgi:peptidyl-tRNA hydrolase
MDGDGDDALAMYLVVRKDVAMTTARAMALAGAATVRCARAFRGSPAWADAFAAWEGRARKVALRAAPQELDELAAGLEAICVDTEHGRTAVALPPRRLSQRTPLLAALSPFTDARRPAEPEPEPERPALTYVVRPGVLRTAGKAMAQAGHAALMALDELAPGRPAAFERWLAAGCPGEVRVATLPAWAALRERPDTVVVRDAGLTQVAPGTETVLACAPADEPAAVVATLPFLD